MSSMLRKTSGVLVFAFLAACGSKSDTPPSPCEGALKDQCGVVCDEVTHCAAGLYCEAGQCTADCTPAEGQCSGVCTSQGRCETPRTGSDSVGGLDLGGAMGSGGTSSGNGSGCPGVTVEFETVTPTVVLLIDVSSSMDAGFGGGDTRWETVQNILTDPAGLIAELQNDVRFGLALYSSVNGSLGADELGGAQCPLLVQVGISFGNFQAIAQTVDNGQLVDDTPTAESITAVAGTLAAFQEFGPKAIVLATDGEPDTCVNPDAQDDDVAQAAARAQSVAAVQGAFQQGISTYIISVGDQISQQHLTELAGAGVGGSPDAQPYTANNTSELVAAFSQIIGGVRSCEFDLQNGTVDAAGAGQGTVLLDGEALGYGDENGWDLPSPNQVRFLGQACNKVQLTGGTVDISFPCGVFTPVR
jgi:hypothetical protein